MAEGPWLRGEEVPPAHAVPEARPLPPPLHALVSHGGSGRDDLSGAEVSHAIPEDMTMRDPEEVWTDGLDALAEKRGVEWKGKDDAGEPEEEDA